MVPLPATGHDDLATRLAGRARPAARSCCSPRARSAASCWRAGWPARARRCRSPSRRPARCRIWRARPAPPRSRRPVRAANLPVGVFPASRTTAALRAHRRAVPGGAAVRRRAGRRAHQRRRGDPPAAGAGQRGRHRRRPLRRPRGGDDGRARGGSSTRSTPSALAARRGLGYPAPHYELATYYDEARAAEGLYGAGAKAKLVRERPLERDAHARAPLRDRGRGAGPHAVRVRRPHRRRGDAGGRRGCSASSARCSAAT